MGVLSILGTGRSGMLAAKTAIGTAGHNIANANTEGASRQRVHLTTEEPGRGPGSPVLYGQGAHVSRIERVNDEYVEKQLRNGAKDLSHFEEKDMVLRQTEDIFNEMNGDGLNRLMAKFFNEFRKLANDPDNEAIRQSVREASQAMVNDFHRLRKEVVEVQGHIDSRIEGHISEVNALSNEIKDLNMRIRTLSLGGGSPNDLMDKRDLVLKKLTSYMDLSMNQDKEGNYNVLISGIGPLVTGIHAESFSVGRSPADSQGKPVNSLDISSSASTSNKITHQIKGGKLGALLEIRDRTLSSVLDRLDDLAYGLSETVNQVHQQGFTRNGLQGIHFFQELDSKERASEFIGLSEEVRVNVNNIAAAAMPDAAGDNRVALQIANLQHSRLMNEGKTTMDDWYNSIVSDVGVTNARNKSNLNQQKDIMTQLNKIREQISGVSIDEETTNLLQFQHLFDASAKVIQVADDMLKTVLDLKR